MRDHVNNTWIIELKIASNLMVIPIIFPLYRKVSEREILYLVYFNAKDSFEWHFL